MHTRNGLIILLSLISFQILGQDQRPNIVFILTDDHRFDGLGYFGNPLARTPELDAIARSGVVFRNAFSSTPICSASRASIFSGLQERMHRYGFQTDAILDQYMDSSYPIMLKNAGYRTAFFGKFGVKYERKDRLFDVYEDYDRNDKFKDRKGYYYKKLGDDTVHLTRYTGQRGVDFINSQTGERPFCLQLAFSAPHAHDGAPDQYFSDQTFDTLFQNMEVAPPQMSEDSFFQAEPAAVRAGFNRLRWTWRFDDPQKYQRMIKAYYRMIAEVDREMGLVRKALRDRGLDRNTVIIFMGDNGYFLGERGLADKWLMYEPSIRVPLVIHDPRSPRHREVTTQTLNIDVPATILDIAGVKQPKNWHGKSLRPIVQGSKEEISRDTILIEHLWAFDQIPASEGIRTSDWKYFRYVDDHRLEFLFDLKKDPEEKENLSKNPVQRTKLQYFRSAFDRHAKLYTDWLGAGPSRLNTTIDRLPNGVISQTPQPKFKWSLADESGKQRGYQLLVAGSRELLDQNIGDYWDTHQVRSGQTEDIVYMGKALQRGTTYYWKVRVWDRANRTTDYSRVDMFTLE